MKYSLVTLCLTFVAAAYAEETLPLVVTDIPEVRSTFIKLKHVEFTEKPTPAPREPTIFAKLKHVEVTEKQEFHEREPTPFAKLNHVEATERPLPPRPSCEDVQCKPGYHCFNGECQGPMRVLTCARVRCTVGYKCFENPARCEREE
ncbi:uncharacterized protein LOC106639405 [Copidosoma floridanum]|uniref:uncharacterized protein LOC106639405 n=1 Tax=Copidosoma floridanum TaxID=29053 RepID=UPI0006C9BADC|nr:uncharacterized protein LOC106639405 [Copidosoma floridanum]